MALWEKVKLLNPQALQDIGSVYSSNGIPIEVRDAHAEWIEDTIHRLHPIEFVNQLFTQIQMKLVSMTGENQFGAVGTPFYVIKLSQFQVTLASMEHSAKSELHQRMSYCLEMEKYNVDIQFGGQPEIPLPPPPQQSGSMVDDAGQHLQTLSLQQHQSQSFENHQSEVTDFSETFLHNENRITIDAEMDVIKKAMRDLDELNNKFSVRRHDFARHQARAYQSDPHLNGIINGVQQTFDTVQELQELRRDIIHLVKKQTLNDATAIYGIVREVLGRTATILTKWTLVKVDLDRELVLWAQHKKLLANGAPTSMTLDKSQHLAEYLMGIVWDLRKFFQTVEQIRLANVQVFNNQNINNGNSIGPDIPVELAKITTLIKQLAQDTFILANEPLQVVKTNTKFPVHDGRSPMEVRLLVGGKLSLHLITPIVKLSLIDEKTAKLIETEGLSKNLFENNKPLQRRGKLNPSHKNFSPESGFSSVVFKGMQINNFIRNCKDNNSESGQSTLVTEEKLCILFQSSFSVDGVEFRIWRKSLPIAICTHVSQYSSAWAAVTWDNEYHIPGRHDFKVHNSVSWESFRQLLNNKFTSMVGTPLPDDNLAYFAEKLQTLPGFPHQLSRSKLCHEDFPGWQFSFWDWFYEGTYLIRKHFKDAFAQGFVRGFVNKEFYETMLTQSGLRHGTFLFRLSDSVCGGMSIMWLDSDGKAYSRAPFTDKVLSAHPLAEKLNQSELLYLYPLDIPKEIGLKKTFDQYNERLAAEKANKPQYVHLVPNWAIRNLDIPRFQLVDKNVSQNPPTTIDTQQPPTNSTCVVSKQSGGHQESMEIYEDLAQFVQSLVAASPSFMDSVDSPVSMESPHQTSYPSALTGAGCMELGSEEESFSRRWNNQQSGHYLPDVNNYSCL